MTSKQPKQQFLSSIRNYIAKVVFTYTQTMGLTDRQELEELTDQVISRLEKGMSPEEQTKSKKIVEPALPGMEHLIASAPPQPPTREEIESTINKLLAEKTSVKHHANISDQVSPRIEPHADKQFVIDQKKDNPNTTAASPTELNLTQNAITVLKKRYLKKDSLGKVIETPEELFRRVSEYIASAEAIFDKNANPQEWADKFYKLMTSMEFLPNSPTLMNAGQELGQLSACFVLPIEDSMESIFDAVKYTALIHKSGGGTGFSFSRIRPKKDKVGSTGGIASGPVSFMRVFDTATDVIKQGGMRRGANMGILNVNHPDILEFIVAKDDPNAFTNFNISVAITDSFMQAVENDTSYDLINPHSMEIVGKLNAREVFNKIVDMAWKTGDPGIIFIDRINEHNPTPQLGKIESTNPCGEQPLLPYESCNLGSINLFKMLKYIGDKPEIDFDKLQETVRLAVRFLDDVIEVNKFPLPQIKEMTHKTRKIGLGVMGFADMLIALGIPYNSDQAIEIAEKIMRFISDEAINESIALGLTRGLFPAFEGSIYDTENGLRVRNANRTTIAPTGTLSIIAGCSSGIEPIFALSYYRNILDGEILIETNSIFEEVAKKYKFYSPELVQKLAKGEGLQDIMGVPEWVKQVFVTSHDISPKWHVKIQAAFQKYTDSAVSKTVNMPYDATHEDVAKVYMLAYKSGLKGITIYRDRSRESQVLNINSQESVKDRAFEEQIEVKPSPRQRPKITKGITERVTTGCGYIYVTVNFDEKGICEVFCSLGKAGGCASAQLEATSRLISLIFRSGIDVASVVKQLRAIRCPSVSWENGRAILSCADAIASVLEKYIKKDDDSYLTMVNSGRLSNLTGQCPDCGNLLVYQEGCHICPSCGYTKCG